MYVSKTFKFINSIKNTRELKDILSFQILNTDLILVIAETSMRIYTFDQKIVMLKNNFVLNFPYLITNPFIQLLESTQTYQINLLGISEFEIFNFTVAVVRKGLL